MAKTVSGAAFVVCLIQASASARVYGWGNPSCRFRHTLTLFACVTSESASDVRHSRTEQCFSASSVMTRDFGGPGTLRNALESAERCRLASWLPQGARNWMRNHIRKRRFGHLQAAFLVGLGLVAAPLGAETSTKQD